MKKYNELNNIQKDWAVGAALEVVIENLVVEKFDYQFKSPYCQKLFLDSFNCFTTEEQINVLVNSDEIAEELYKQAEVIARVAHYPEKNEVVLKGVV